MNLYLKALAQQLDGPPAEDYAWIVDIDHLADEGETGDAGTMGPSQAPAELLAKLEAGFGDAIWKVYDDDGELYYTGRLVCILEEDGLPSNEAMAGPLDDWGVGAGATEVRYPGKPHWNCP
ncbi:hypothetical protein [Kribbella italica]|uniref:Uncharacterized protein n=1 Tax=Kribbella italica TaxID=1540520 RepID=A0A7W9J1P6_9ACTN|nr:hypothetical protein [Kribbella italica]MBB5833442.1 hypothetical protein [Kribbella italica]